MLVSCILTPVFLQFIIWKLVSWTLDIENYLDLSKLFYPAAAEDFVVVIDDTGLARGDSELRFIEFDEEFVILLM